jgi:hypothetical protein
VNSLAAEPALAPDERRSVLDALARMLRREAHVLSTRPDLFWQQPHNHLRWGGQAVREQLEPGAREPGREPERSRRSSEVADEDRPSRIGSVAQGDVRGSHWGGLGLRGELRQLLHRLGKLGSDTPDLGPRFGADTSGPSGPHRLPDSELRPVAAGQSLRRRAAAAQAALDVLAGEVRDESEGVGRWRVRAGRFESSSAPRSRT